MHMTVSIASPIDDGVTVHSAIISAIMAVAMLPVQHNAFLSSIFKYSFPLSLENFYTSKIVIGVECIYVNFAI